EIMKSIPQAAKNAYIVTKATWSQADNRREHKPSSYQLKTTLFVSCAKMLRNKEDVDGVSVAEWVRMIYDSKFDKCLDKLVPKLRHFNESVVNAKDDFDWTPANLIFAKFKVNVENSADLNRLYVELLTSFFESGLHPAEVDRHGASLLHYAAGTGSCGALEMLIKQCRHHALNSVDSFSSTPLHFAVAATQREATEILFKSEIDKNAKDCKGRTALDLAKLFGSENIMQLLDKDCN
ncbi:hypothetical protein CAPTEDRAFT_194284, partial [Capitella teleta]